MDTPLPLGPHELKVQGPIVLAANLGYAPDTPLDALSKAGAHAITIPLWSGEDQFSGFEQTQYAFLSGPPPTGDWVRAKVAAAQALRLAVVLAPFPSRLPEVRQYGADALIVEPPVLRREHLGDLKAFAGALLVHDALLTQEEVGRLSALLERPLAVLHGHAGLNPNPRELDIGTMSNIQIYFKHHIGFRDPTSRVFSSIIAGHMGAEYVERYVGEKTEGCTMSLEDFSLLARCLEFVFSDNYNSVHELVMDMKAKLKVDFEEEYRQLGLKTYMTALLGRGLKATQKGEMAWRTILLPV